VYTNLEKRKKSGNVKGQEKNGKSRNFVIGQGIFIVFVVNIVLQKFANLALLSIKKEKNFFFLLDTLAINS
jgi:hypothetical protein